MQADQIAPQNAAGEAPDFYARHLAAVDATNAVVSTEDIINSRGVLVVRAGTRINNEIAERIVQHKLLKPLDEQVQLSNLLDAGLLRNRFDGLMGRFPDLRGLLDGSGLERDFFNQVLTTRLPPVLAQNLTVLQEQADSIFEKGLFCAAISSLIAREMDLDRDDISAVYLAGLLHDIGLLRIPPVILDKGSELDVDEWRALQSHVVIGKLLVERVPGVPPKTAQAVLEHHERCDGSGYPAGKTEEQLGLLGQIVAMADSLQAIRVNQFQRHGLNLANALPYLQMNSTTHFYPVYEAMLLALKRCGLPAARFNVTETVPVLASRLLARGRALASVLPMLERIQAVAGELPAGRRSRIVGRLSERVLRMIQQSGLLWEALIVWLESLIQAPEAETLEELNTIDLMQQELRWQIGSLRRSLNELLEKEAPANEAARRELQAALELSGSCLQQLEA